MKLTAVVKLQPSEHQRQRLYATLERANAACNAMSEAAWDAKQFGRVPVHHLTYNRMREEFALTAQLAVRCIGKVVDAYKLDKKHKCQFKKLGAIPYDSRILNWRLATNTVSIWVLGERELIPFVTGEHQRALLAYQHGESDLVYRKGVFYLYTTCDVPEETPIAPEGWLGVDLGIANIAVDSDGTFHQGKGVERVRYRHRRLRARLQAAQTDSARRHLKRLAGKERRVATDTNHRISKRIVEKAQGTTRGIALEDLTHIRKRITARKARRATLHSWSFAQLQAFIDYKAQRVGVSVVFVDPRNTSRTCPNPACRHVDEANRKSQAQFCYVVCGCVGHADHVAAVEIGCRAVVNPPIVGMGASASSTYKPPRLRGGS